MNIFRNMLYMARRFKTATVLNFIGLTVALTAFYLLMTQVVYNISYNSCIPDNERVFRFETKMVGHQLQSSYKRHPFGDATGRGHD